MENPKWTTWVYLIASAAISYYLLKVQNGQEEDFLLSLAHNVRKVARKVENGLTRYIDQELDHRRTV